MNTKMNTTKKLSIAVIALFATATIFTSCSKQEGCTDPAATNFDVEAEKDDGSCKYEEVKEEETAMTSTITFNFSHHFDGVPITAANFNQFNFHKRWQLTV